MTPPINALIFDFGGVLVNWDPHQVFLKYFSNDIQAIDRFFAEINFAGWNDRQDEGYPFKQAVADLSVQFPQYAHLIRAYDEEWEESITGIIPGTVEILPTLKAAGYSLYGLTNWNAEKFTLVQHKFDFFNLFDDILVSGAVKLAKPDPAIFRLLLARIHRSPQECLLVDDSIKNVKAAQGLGFSAIHFTSPPQLELELRHLGVL